MTAMDSDSYSSVTGAESESYSSVTGAESDSYSSVTGMVQVQVHIRFIGMLINCQSNI